MTSTTETIANLEGPNDLLESEIPTTWSPELTSIIMQSLLGTINSTMNSLNSSLTNSLNTTASPYELLEDLQETTEAFANLNGTLREEEFKEWQKTSKCISSHTCTVLKNSHFRRYESITLGTFGNTFLPLRILFRFLVILSYCKCPELPRI